MSVLSSVSALLFALFNFYLETLYETGWNTGIGIYYCLLVLSKSIVVLSEKSWATKQLDENQKQKKRERMLLRQSILLFAVDLSLVAPLALMIFQKRHIEYTEISAIAVAAYTCYKTVMASIMYSISKANDILNQVCNVLIPLLLKIPAIAFFSLFKE